MTKDQLYDYSEALADIAYEAGVHRLRIDGDSRTVIREVVAWAKEFHERHQNTDWHEIEYLDTIYTFIEEKLGQHMFNIETKCPECPSKNLRYEIIKGPHEEEQYRVVCPDCGRVIEGETAKDFLLDALYDIYWDILWDNGQAEYDIEPYLKENLSIGDGLMSSEDIISEFKEWKEQNDLAFEKIQDTNYYSQI